MSTPNQVHTVETGAGNRPVLTEKEAATWLSLKESTLRAWRYRGKGPSFLRFGSAIRYSIDDLEDFMDSSRVTQVH